MTIKEAENFYNMDKKEYKIENNKYFLEWLNNSIEQGYKPFIDLDEIQKMIDNITTWYELKYPKRELDSEHGITYLDYENPEKLSKYMDFNQLMHRLPHDQLCLMECGYRSTGWSYPDIFIPIERKSENPIFAGRFLGDLISVNHYTGIVSKSDLENINVYTNGPVIIDELLNNLIKNNRTDINYSNISKTVYNHQIDLQLRKKVLELVALNLLYSRNTIPEYGYERAKRFIDEINKEIYNLNLSTKDIDSIMTYDYSSNKNSIDVVHEYIDSAPVSSMLSEKVTSDKRDMPKRLYLKFKDLIGKKDTN